MKFKLATVMIVTAVLLLLSGAAFAQATVDSMKYEVVQTNPPAGTPPTAAQGFCSTNGGLLGCDNLQRYIRIEGTPGGPIIGKWLSAGDDVAPLLVQLLNLDTIYAEFFDNNTYNVLAIDVNGTQIPFSGTYTTSASGVGNIMNITLEQSTPTVVTSEGIYEITTHPVGIGDPVSNELFSFELRQNYPNPFNPATRISFQIPQKSAVTLRVFNALGQEVVTLVEDIRPAGLYGVDFRGEDLPSGIYFYRLWASTPSGEAGNFNDVKKMLLVR
jgi:hypothetical protein